MDSEVTRILIEASEIMGDDFVRAAVWFHRQPLSGFDGQTAQDLVATGHAQVVLTHLAMLRDGLHA